MIKHRPRDAAPSVAVAVALLLLLAGCGRSSMANSPEGRLALFRDHIGALLDRQREKSASDSDALVHFERSPELFIVVEAHPSCAGEGICKAEPVALDVCVRAGMLDAAGVERMRARFNGTDEYASIFDQERKTSNYCVRFDDPVRETRAEGAARAVETVFTDVFALGEGCAVSVGPIEQV